MRPRCLIYLLPYWYNSVSKGSCPISLTNPHMHFTILYGIICIHQTWLDAAYTRRTVNLIVILHKLFIKIVKYKVFNTSTTDGRERGKGKAPFWNTDRWHRRPFENKFNRQTVPFNMVPFRLGQSRTCAITADCELNVHATNNVDLEVFWGGEKMWLKIEERRGKVQLFVDTGVTWPNNVKLKVSLATLIKAIQGE